MSEHRASCQCGQLKLEASGSPDFVIACNCRACQKRTGSAFGAGQYFKKNGVTVFGDYSNWERVADSGNKLSNHFCPRCGTTVFWSLELRPDHFGVALGGFDTPPLTPTRANWMEEKLDWVQFPENWDTFDKGSPPAK
jgi:hypothetical protein